MKKLLCVFTMLLVMAGCSASEKTESITCKTTGSGEGGNPTIQGIYHYTVGENPKIASFEIDTEIKFDGADFKKEAVESSVKSIEETYAQYDGIDYSYSSDDTKLTEHIEVDLSKVTKEVLQLLNNSIEPDNFNLENFKANMTALGYTCE